MSPAEFANLYFAFLLSGNAGDFQLVCKAFTEALQNGATMEELQTLMDESHTTAEMLCLMSDNHPVEKLG